VQFEIGASGERIDLIVRKSLLISGYLPFGVVELAVVAKVVEVPRVRLRFLWVARHPIAVSPVD
jgi:hypothetical protein